MNLLALAGGVGGAKLAHGLAQILPPENLTIVVNTGDDFEHLGLYISPDLDTVCYTLAGLANPDTGWGRAGETWHAMADLKRLGAPDWFNLGDRDLATHLERTRRIKAGQPLSRVTRDFYKAWGVQHTVLPMSDDPVRTLVDTDEGELPFQEYFVHRHCEPRVRSFRFDGLSTASPAPGVREALQSADAIVICPSNPWVSIDPILSVLFPNAYPLTPNSQSDTSTLRHLDTPAPIVAISPIVGGKTIKGPAAKMFFELGIEPSIQAVANHYENLLNGIVVDSLDSNLAKRIKIPTLVTNTIMQTNADRARLAQETLQFIGTLP